MAKETERRFLVDVEALNKDMNIVEAYELKLGGEYPQIVRMSIAQGYLPTAPDFVNRIRSIEYTNLDQPMEHINTYKANFEGYSCDEIEFSIPATAFSELFGLCRSNVLYKSRNKFWCHQSLWEVDFFHGNLQGLVIAEIELVHPDQEFVKPHWLGREITGDKQYSNYALAHSQKLPLDYIQNHVKLNLNLTDPRML